MGRKTIRIPERRDERGILVFNLEHDAANADWIRAARLQRRAEEGDEEAAAELERLFNTPMKTLHEPGEMLDPFFPELRKK